MYSSGGGSSIGRWGWGMVAFASEPNTLSWDNEKHTTSVSMSCPHPWDKHQIKERVHVSVYVWRNDDNNRYSWDNGACACIVASFLPHLASPSKLNGRSLGIGGGKWFGCTVFFYFCIHLFLTFLGQQAFLSPWSIVQFLLRKMFHTPSLQYQNIPS